MARGRVETDLVTIEWNTDKLDRLIQDFPEQVEDALSKLALDTQADVTDSWNPASPAPAGGPPGVDTGALKNSVKARHTGPLEWTLADWATDQYGGDYGLDLEFGHVTRGGNFVGPWPWMRPAVERVLRRAPRSLIKAFKVRP